MALNVTLAQIAMRGGRNRIGRREKLAQKEGRREIYSSVPPLL